MSSITSKNLRKTLEKPERKRERLKQNSLDNALADAGRSVVGVVSSLNHVLPDHINSLFLLGPYGLNFWETFSSSPEYLDGKADPMDRWSKRVIDFLANELSGTAYYPFGGPPYQPFIKWALASGRCYQSPIGLLVHDKIGLNISFRGAIGFEAIIPVQNLAENPCQSCQEKPCLTACPVDAFGTGNYDIPLCTEELRSDGNNCITQGCQIRNACPAGRNLPMNKDRSNFHMQVFLDSHSR